jgi:adenine-specific DNA methylase
MESIQMNERDRKTASVNVSRQAFENRFSVAYESPASKESRTEALVLCGKKFSLIVSPDLPLTEALKLCRLFLGLALLRSAQLVKQKFCRPWRPLC